LPEGGIGKNGNLAANAAALNHAGRKRRADRKIYHAGGRGMSGFGSRPLQRL